MIDTLVINMDDTTLISHNLRSIYKEISPLITIDTYSGLDTLIPIPRICKSHRILSTSNLCAGIRKHHIPI